MVVFGCTVVQMKYVISIIITLISWNAQATLSKTVFNSIQRSSFDVLINNHLEGSGIIVHPSGLAFIAGHATRRNQNVLEARSIHLGRLSLEIIALDLGHDLALVRLPPRSQAYPFRPIAKGGLAPGMDIYLYGTPLYRHGVLIKGSVGRIDPTYEYLPDMGYYVRILHVAASSPPGTSGGAWMNSSGEVVGLQSGLMHEGGAPVGIAYMSPLNALRKLAKTKKTVPTMALSAGLEEFWEQTPQFRQKYGPNQEGLVAVKVRPGGTAYIAGIRDGDVITHIGQTPVAYRDQFLQRFRSKRAKKGLKVILTAPDGSTRTIKMMPTPLGKIP